jgi:hypothetical protein
VIRGKTNKNPRAILEEGNVDIGERYSALRLHARGTEGAWGVRE